jgi:ElaB/YqjD/DUF883 family membrane-anchored ribosome-binding protein
VGGFRRTVFLMKTAQFRRLLTDVEELLASLDDEHSPLFHELRDRVEANISQAKAALTKHSNATVSQVRHYGGMADDYITGYPRTAFASGILIGGLLGFLLASVRSSK